MGRDSGAQGLRKYFKAEKIYPALISVTLTILFVLYQNCGNQKVVSQSLASDGNPGLYPRHDVQIVNPGSNLVPDPSFESDPQLQNKVISANKSAEFDWSEGGHTGQRSIGIKNMDGSITFEGKVMPNGPRNPFSAEPGEMVNASVFVTGFGLEGIAFLEVTYLDSNLSEVSRVSSRPYTVSQESTDPTKGWSKLSFSSTVPKLAKHMSVSFSLKGVGQVFFDDLEVIKFPPPLAQSK